MPSSAASAIPATVASTAAPAPIAAILAATPGRSSGIRPNAIPSRISGAQEVKR